jgi:deoxyuridine 5'-triphosphate nucleotidohydrolase
LRITLVLCIRRHLACISFSQMPEGVYGRVAPRSGLAWKNHIDVGAGVIDADYRGDIGVVLFNHGSEALEVKLHDRVAQLILERHMMGEEVKEVADLDETERGSGGYGSTGFGAAIEKPN